MRIHLFCRRSASIPHSHTLRTFHERWPTSSPRQCLANVAEVDPDFATEALSAHRANIDSTLELLREEMGWLARTEEMESATKEDLRIYVQDVLKGLGARRAELETAIGVFRSFARELS